MASWVHGVGGVASAIAIIILMILEASWVEASVIVLAAWSDDSDGAHFSVNNYFILYGGTICGEFLAAYVRQVVYAVGTRAAADDLHAALLHRVTNAQSSFFDNHMPGAILALFGRDLACIDRETWFSSEYFTLAVIYSATVVVIQVLYMPVGLLALVLPAVFYFAAKAWRGGGVSVSSLFSKSAGDDAATAMALPADAEAAQVTLDLKEAAAGDAIARRDGARTGARTHHQLPCRYRQISPLALAAQLLRCVLSPTTLGRNAASTL